MRIGIDARFFGPLGKGLGRYTENLILELQQIDQKNQYYIFLSKDNFNLFEPKQPNFHKVLADISWYTIQEQLKMPQLLNRYKLDLVHFPHFNVPILYRRSFIVTIHDLILIEYPTRKASTKGAILYFLKNLGYKKVISYAVQKSKAIVAISEFTKTSIIKHFKVKPDKIKMIYEGVDLIRFNPVMKQSFDFKQFGIEKDKYILYVGNVYPHKNIDGLVRIFNQLKQDKGYKSIKLVLVGKQDYFFDQLHRLVKDLDLQDSVIFTGYVPDEQLIDLYESCNFYIFPSQYEGFGLPPLEAMALGAAVLSSDKTCLPEIFRNAALYFNPDNSQDFLDKIKYMLNDPKIKLTLREGSKDVLATYSWQDMAQKTLEVYLSHKK